MFQSIRAEKDGLSAGERLTAAKVLLPVVALMLILLNACTGAVPPGELKLAPLSDLPTDLQTASVEVHEAYQFAVANKDLLEQVPCYCGCAVMGHKNNYDCYVMGEDTGGLLVYDSHASF